MSYVIRKAPAAPDLAAAWDDPAWKDVPVIRLWYRCPGFAGWMPRTEFKLQYTSDALFGMFQVSGDLSLKCVHTEFQSEVCEDSCVEMFIEPSGGKGYINFEVNAIGTFLSYHIEDARRVPGGFAKFRPLTPDDLKGFEVFHSVQTPPPFECDGEQTYRVAWRIPFAVFQRVMGKAAPDAGEMWRGNVFKCGGKSEYEHYQCYLPVPEVNFHMPEHFGNFIFE